MRNRRASIPSPARLFDPRAVLGLAVSCVVIGCRSAPTAPHSHHYDGDWPVSTALGHRSHPAHQLRFGHPGRRVPQPPQSPCRSPRCAPVRAPLPRLRPRLAASAGPTTNGASVLRSRSSLQLTPRNQSRADSEISEGTSWYPSNSRYVTSQPALRRLGTMLSRVTVTGRTSSRVP